MESKIKLEKRNGDVYGYNIRKDTSVIAYVMINHQLSNCKLSTVEYLPPIILTDRLTPEEKIESINLILGKSRLLLFTRLNSKECYEFLKEHFELAYCIEVPIGYSEKYQYHIGIANSKSYSFNDYFKRRENKVVSVLYSRNFTGSKIRTSEIILDKELESIEKDGLKTVKGVLNRLKRKFITHE